MAAGNLPQPYQSDRPASRSGDVTPWTGAVPAAGRTAATGPPVHSARDLGFTGIPGRNHWWQLIDDKLKTRIHDRVGPTVEWWAYHHATYQDRAYVVVLGPHGLAVTTPTVNDAGRPAQLLQVRRFVPGSLRHVIVRQQPQWTGPATGAAGRTSIGGPGTAPPEPRLALTEDVRGFLGNLPTEAQARLQAPFLGADPVQASDYFYEGSAEQLDVWCYLAGGRTVTFASGRRVAAAGAPPQAASWQVICRQAEIAPK
ncbi:hypothetical protein [Plantactinospora sonchi]|uniref:Uncharacterized protein n=1 Tax=Plantactinospora sonchi TaxID=1544735 RepID=A0ABU7RSB7_9ACTN